MKRFSLISAFALVLLFAVTPALAYPDIEVVPTSHDFGSISLGNPATTVITIFNVGGHPLRVDSLDFQAGSSSYFHITAVPPLPAYIPAPNGKPNWFEIEVTYSPSCVGVHSAVLEIVSNDPDEGLVQVVLMGTGVWTGPSPLEISPMAYDFGDVEVGTCSETIITITMTDISKVYAVKVNGVYLSDDHDPSFTSVSLIPFILYPWMSVHIPVKFCPQATGSYSTSLWVDTCVGIFEVVLSGTGVQGPSPEEQVQEILDFIDESVEAGTLWGIGLGSSADKRLNALIHMIETAKDLIEQGRYEEACDQLWIAYGKCDGDPSPPDFVEGEAREQLAAMILTLIESLGYQ